MSDLHTRLKQARIRAGVSLTTILFAVAVAIAGAGEAHAQALPAVERSAAISAFGAVSHVNTDYGSVNYGATVGADYTRYFRHFSPSLEARYTWSPQRDSGIVEQTGAGGVKVETSIAGLRPYADVLVGFGTIKYIFSPQVSASDSSILYQAGMGIDYSVTSNFSIKIDGQVQRWTLNLGPNPLEPIILSAGISYSLPARRVVAALTRGMHY